MKLSLVLLSAAVAAAVPWNTTVMTKYGAVQGTVEGNVIAFHSIPFAAPPLGPLRFAPPTSPAPWSGIRDVSAIPPVCPQLQVSDLFDTGNEDCLYVNVYVPPTVSAGPLPVLFWIYGGGFIGGSGYDGGAYNASEFALNNGVIVVAANYRLNAFGFLALPELLAESNTTGNYGVQDQVAALQWVQANIAAFGGDPTKVTIAGESAGGFSICLHLVNPQSSGLFAGAVMQSGSCDAPQFFQSMAYATKFSGSYATGCGCPYAGAELLSCMRALSKDALLSCNANYTLAAGVIASLGLPPSLWPFMPWSPTIDGYALTDLPLTLIKAGTFNKVPTIFGTNGEEGAMFSLLTPFLASAQTFSFPPNEAMIGSAVERLLDMYTADSVAAAVPLILASYPSTQYPDGFQRVSVLFTDYFFRCGTRRSAAAVDSAGVPMYLYEFNLACTNNILYDLFGDYHSIEVPYVFGHSSSYSFDADEAAVSAAMQAYWTNLAKSGSPNAPVWPAVTWPRFNASTLLNLDLSSPINVNANLNKPLCDFWDKLLPTLVLAQ